jgi:hypothetical protein
MSDNSVTAKKRTFSYAEAAAMLPELERLTDAAYQRVTGLQPRAEGGAVDAQRAIEETIRGWAETIQSRGVEVKGLWLIDFDSGSGYYCWRYPERGLRFFHSYEEGFPGRIPIQ